MFKFILIIIWVILGCAGGMNIAQHTSYMLPEHGAILGLILSIVLKVVLEK